MADLANLTVKLEAQTAAFERGMNNASKSIARLDKRFSSAQRTAQRFSKIFVGFFAGRAMINMVRNTVKFGDEIAKLSVRLDASAEFLTEMKYAAESSGVGFNTFATSLQRMERRLGEIAATGKGEALPALKELGIAFEDLQGLSPEDQFNKIAQEMSKMEDHQKKLFVAMKLWDTEGVAMVQMIGDGEKGLAKMRERAKELGAVLTDKMAKGLEKASQAGADMNTAMQGLASTLVAALSPALEWAAQKVADFFATVNVGLRRFLDDMTRIEQADIGQLETKRAQLANDYLAAEGDRKNSIKKLIDRVDKRIIDLNKSSTSMREASAKMSDTMDVVTTKAGGGGKALKSQSDGLENVAKAYQALRESLEPLYALENKHQDNIITLMEAYDAGLVPLTLYEELMGKLGVAYDKAAQKIKDAAGEASAWTEIINRAAEDFAAGMADTLVDSILSADASFAEFAKNFLANIAKMIVQAQILAAIEGVMGKFNIGGGSVSTASAGISQFGAPSAPSLFSTPAMRMPSSSGGRTGVSVQVNNYADATVTTQEETDSAGNVSITMMIENAMKDAFGRGAMDRTMNSNFGARRVPA